MDAKNFGCDITVLAAIHLLHANVTPSRQEIECLPREINPDQDRSRSAPDQGGYEILVGG